MLAFRSSKVQTLWTHSLTHHHDSNHTSVLKILAMYDLPPCVVFGPSDPEIVLYYLLNRVNGEPTFEDSMNYITECDVYGDPNAWIKVFQETHWSVSISTQNWRRRIRKGSELRDLHTGTWRCQKDEQLFLNETQYGSKRSFTFVAKNGFNGMGRWTMHEFRLDGLYGNMANYVRLLIFLILFNIHSNALFLDFLDALFLDFLWKLFLCLYIWGLYLSPSL